MKKILIGVALLVSVLPLITNAENYHDPDSNFKIGSIFGLEKTYYENETVTVSAEAFESRQDIATKGEGFNVQVFINDPSNRNKGALEAVNAEYDYAQDIWKAVIKAPSKKGKYEIEFVLYCSNRSAGSYCDEEYGDDGQVVKRVKFNVKKGNSTQSPKQSPMVASGGIFQDISVPTNDLNEYIYEDNGPVILYRYKISAPEDSDVVLKNETIYISRSGVSFEPVTLKVFSKKTFKKPIQSKTVLGTAVNNATEALVYGFSPDIRIKAGKTVYLQAETTIGGSKDVASITTGHKGLNDVTVSTRSVVSSSSNNLQNLSINSVKLSNPNGMDFGSEGRTLDQLVTVTIKNNQFGPTALGKKVRYEIYLYDVTSSSKKLFKAASGEVLVPYANGYSEFSAYIEGGQPFDGSKYEKKYRALIKIDTSNEVSESNENDNEIWSDSWNITYYKG